MVGAAVRAAVPRGFPSRPGTAPEGSEAQWVPQGPDKTRRAGKPSGLSAPLNVL